MSRVLTVYRSIFTATKAKAIVLILPVLILAGGCAAQLEPSEAPRPDVTAVSEDHSPVSPGGEASQLIANDLVNTLVQVKRLQPGDVALQMREYSHAFGSFLHATLLTMGYDVTAAVGLPTANVVSFTVTDQVEPELSSSDKINQIYQLSVNEVTISRDYVISAGRVEPQSPMQVDGTDSTNIRNNDDLFKHALWVPETIVHEEPKVPDTASTVLDDLKIDSLSSLPVAGAAATLETADLFSMAMNRLSETASPPAPTVSIRADREYGSAPYRVGEPIELLVIPARNSRLFCYYQDGENSVAQIFPNRFSPDNLVQAGQTVLLPDSSRWQLNASLAGIAEEFMCMAVDPALTEQLGELAFLPDLQSLPIVNLEQVYQEFSLVVADELSQNRLSVDVAD